MTTSQIETQDLNLLNGQSEYISDTSVHYDLLPHKFSTYSLDKVAFDNTYRIQPDLIIFQIAIVDNSGSTTAGRAIWIELPSVLKEINIIKTEVGNMVAFEYPGENTSLYMRQSDTWSMVSPITSTMVWLSTPLHKISELAIVNGTIETGTILHRRTFNENTLTT